MVRPWAGVYDATAYAPSCPQSPNWEGTAAMAEDCLFVNVWMPADREPQPNGTMIFIHGGSFREGSIGAAYGGSLVFNGSQLAASRGVVVATLQYRLGLLGVFSHGGNLNLRDQQTAMRFLRAILDPAATARVLLFGHSAGANSVCAHLAMPSSRGLFSAAVIMSGTCAVLPSELVHEKSRQVALQSSCGGSLDARTLECLRNLTLEQLLRTSRSPLVASSPSDPMLEASTLPSDPAIALSSGDVARVPVIVGNAADEAYWAFIYPGGSINTSRPLSFEEYRRWMRTHFCAPLSRFCGPSDAETLVAHCESHSTRWRPPSRLCPNLASHRRVPLVPLGAPPILDAT